MVSSRRFAVLFAVGPALAFLLQAPPPPVAKDSQDRTASNEQMWTVRGCIRGSRLERSMDSGGDALTDLYPHAAFALKGNRELLSQLKKDHAGHLEEVTGIVVLPRQPKDDGLVGEKKVGSKTRVTVGGRDRYSDGGVNPVEPTLLPMTVRSFTHIADSCVSKQ